MTISSQLGRQSYAGDGDTTEFTVPFKFFDSSDLTVILQSEDGVDATLTENVHYTVEGAGDEDGGTITMETAPASGETLTIILDPPRTQLTDYVSNDAFPAESHERALDRLTQQNIRTRDIVNRALRLPDGDASVMPTLPGAATRAGKFLRFDNNGDPEMATGIDQSQTLSQSVIGQFLYPQTPAEVAAGVTPVNYAYPYGNVRRYGAKGDGTTDDTDAFQRAIDALPAGGGDIIIPAGDYVIESGLDLADRRSIRFLGVGFAGGGASQSCILRLTATSGDRIIDCRSSLGVSFENLMILQTGTGFAGHVIDYGWSDAVSDAFMGAVKGCYISGVSTAASLVNLNKAHSMLMDSTHFVGGDCALLGGGGDYANRINVQNCTFREQETAPIKDPGAVSQAWLISGNTFEPAADSKAAAIYSSGRITDVVFCANWCGDANTTGAWIDVGAMDCCTIFANQISSGAKGIVCSAPASNDGNTIFGNTFIEVTTALDISAASGWRGEYVNNFFQTVTNPLIGTPTGGRYQTQNGGMITHVSSEQWSNSVANGFGGTISGSILAVLTGLAGNVGLSVRGASSQTANLQTWENSAGTVLTAIGPTGYIEMGEQTTPSAPGTNRVRIFAEDDGSGKTRLRALFASGTAVTIATDA